MSVPADVQSVHSTTTAVHAFDPELDIPIVLDDKLHVDPFLVRFSPGDPENPKVHYLVAQPRLVLPTHPRTGQTSRDGISQ